MGSLRACARWRGRRGRTRARGRGLGVKSWRWRISSGHSWVGLVAMPWCQPRVARLVFVGGEVWVRSARWTARRVSVGCCEVAGLGMRRVMCGWGVDVGGRTPCTSP